MSDTTKIYALIDKLSANISKVKLNTQEINFDEAFKSYLNYQFIINDVIVLNNENIIQNLFVTKLNHDGFFRVYIPKNTIWIEFEFEVISNRFDKSIFINQIYPN